MAKTGISNKQRRVLGKQNIPVSRRPAAEPIVKVAAKPAPEPKERDGLLWLAKKKRLSSAQLGEALHYRRLFRSLAPGGSTPSCLGSLGMGGRGGAGSGVLMEGDYGDAAAQLELMVLRSHVLQGQVDLLTVMDGVCGLGHTVRYLGGGDQLRPVQLEAALRIALDMLVTNRRAKDAAKETRLKAA